MSASAAAARLIQSGKEVNLQWERTREHWRDARSLHFEKEYMAELPHHLARAVEAIQEINALLKKVKEDCE